MGNVIFSKQKLFVCLFHNMFASVYQSMNVEKRQVPRLLFCVVCIFMFIKIVVCSSCQIKLLCVSRRS
jgi:hypothetical protein